MTLVGHNDRPEFLREFWSGPILASDDIREHTSDAKNGTDHSLSWTKTCLLPYSLFVVFYLHDKLTSSKNVQQIEEIIEGDSGILGKIRVLSCRSRTYERPITSSDAVPTNHTPYSKMASI